MREIYLTTKIANVGDWSHIVQYIYSNEHYAIVKNLVFVKYVIKQENAHDIMLIK